MSSSKRARGSREEPTDDSFSCRIPGCGYTSSTSFGVDTHIRMTHTKAEDVEMELFGDPVDTFSDPDYVFAVNEPNADETSSSEIVAGSESGNSSGQSSDIDCNLPDIENVDDEPAFLKDSVEEEELEICKPYDLSNISLEDLQFFQISEIALNHGFSQITLKKVINFLKESSVLNSNWKASAQSHWDLFDRLCIKYGFKEEQPFLQKEISLSVFKISDSIILNYVQPRLAIIRLLRSMDWRFFKFRTDVDSYKNEQFREFFSGKWAHFTELEVRSKFEKEMGLENVFLLGIIIMTDSSTINLKKSKKPFYFAIANCDYNYRNNISCMESVCTEVFY